MVSYTMVGNARACKPIGCTIVCTMNVERTTGHNTERTLEHQPEDLIVHGNTSLTNCGGLVCLA
jgi:hypothetical protein